MELTFSDGYGGFPDPDEANEDGLLAMGAELVPDRLQYAYENGIFPWYNEEDPICWYCPPKRFVLFPADIYISSSMKTFMNNPKIDFSQNQRFVEVISHCADVRRKDQDGTWIHPEMIVAYTQLHKMGLAHSIEVWESSTLIGGLYGIQIGRVFCGESMFSKKSNASKAALIWLATSGLYDLIDCQMPTPHLESMGASMINRDEFLNILKKQ